MEKQSPTNIQRLNENLLKELKSLALKRAAERKNWKEIARELKDNGADDSTANALARQAVSPPKWFGSDWRAAGLGLLMLIGGAVLLLFILGWFVQGGVIPVYTFILAPVLILGGLITIITSLRRH